MQTSSTARDAKGYLVARIVSQAQRDGTSLSDVEQKMLYFSETAWTLPDIEEVCERFDRNNDQGEFERKIARLVRNIHRALVLDKEEARNWDQAVRVLRSEDHYLLVLIDSAGTVRPRGDITNLILTALVIVSVFVAAMVFFVYRR